MGEFKHISEILKPIIDEITVQTEIHEAKPPVELMNIIYDFHRESNILRNKRELNGDMMWHELKKGQLKEDERLKRAIFLINKMEEM